MLGLQRRTSSGQLRRITLFQLDREHGGVEIRSGLLL